MNPPPPSDLVHADDAPQPVAHYEQPVHEDQVALAHARRRLLQGEQKFLLAVIAGTAAAVVSGVIWAAVTVATAYQIGWMAIGVGVLVGFAVRIGKGVDVHFGILGATLALVGCLLGNFLSIVGFVSKQEGLGVLQVLADLNYPAIPDMMMSGASPMDLLFYGIAVYEGYRFSFRKV